MASVLATITGSMTIVAGSVFTVAELLPLVNTENLTVFAMQNCHVPPNTLMQALALHNNNNLTSIDLTGTTGFTATIPPTWHSFTKLRILTLSNMGYTTVQIDALLTSILAAINAGMMTAATSPKTITIIGNNAAPSAAGTTTKAAIAAKGVTIVTI